jgi:hypothetical protein
MENRSMILILVHISPRKEKLNEKFTLNIKRIKKEIDCINEIYIREKSVCYLNSRKIILKCNNEIKFLSYQPYKNVELLIFINY